MSKSRASIESGEPPRPGRLLYQQSMPSVLDGKNDSIEQIVAALEGLGFLSGENDSLRARLCFDEALVNAIRHGNGYDQNKKVTITVSVTRAKWNVLVEDEGDGFIETDVPDPEDPSTLLMEGGRGILIMRSFLTRSTHYRGGSALLMEKFERPAKARNAKSQGAS